MLTFLQYLAESPILRGNQTGLPLPIQCDLRRASHSCRVKVSIDPNKPPSKDPSNYTFALVIYRTGESVVSKDTKSIADKLDPTTLQTIQDWIQLNIESIWKLWDGKYLSTIDFQQDIKPV